MRHLTLPFALALAAGCNGPPPPIVNLVVDSNRSGLLEAGDPSEDADENVWDAKHGAVFLANLDDDDMDGKPDADDDKVNGPNDIADLSPIVLRAWPLASLKASGTFGIDAAAAPNVRLYRVSGPADNPGSYSVVADPTKVAISNAELLAGVQFAIEGKTFLKSTAAGAWNGKVQLSFAVTDETVKDPMFVPLLADAAVLRVAPVLFQFNTAPAEKLLYTDAGQYTATLVEGMTPMAAAAGNKPIEALPLDDLGLDVDVWAQDFLDIGYTSRPGPGGKPIGMKVAIRSAQPERSAGEVAEKHFFGPDWATVFEYDKDNTPHNNSMNSFGNWDVIPPYEKGSEKYPLGRNLWGATSDPRSSPDPVFQEFVRAQAVQPEINVDTSWLGVGHVDEFTSWVKSSSPRGWAMLRASPKDARTMLQDLDGKGMGGSQLFVNKTVYDWQKRKEVPAAVAITTVLGSANLMAANQSAQSKVDSETTKLIGEIGLAASEVIEMPFLYERSFGGAAAFIPGTVNLLYADGKVLIPDPFGPEVSGVDPFKEDLRTRLGAIGLEVFFADDWDTFHQGGGEVHCGTNAVRDMTLRWWESGR